LALFFQIRNTHRASRNTNKLALFFQIAKKKAADLADYAEEKEKSQIEIRKS